MELYNDSVKKKFIEQVKKEEQPQLLSIFRKGAELEEYLKKTFMILILKRFLSS